MSVEFESKYNLEMFPGNGGHFITVQRVIACPWYCCSIQWITGVFGAERRSQLRIYGRSLHCSGFGYVSYGCTIIGITYAYICNETNKQVYICPLLLISIKLPYTPNNVYTMYMCTYQGIIIRHKVEKTNIHNYSIYGGACIEAYQFTSIFCKYILV